MVPNHSPFLVKLATVEQVFHPKHRSFVLAFLDLNAHTEQLLKRAVRTQLGSIRDGLVVELVDDLFMGQAFAS